jgi:hypothetical protein
VALVDRLGSEKESAHCVVMLCGRMGRRGGIVMG